MRLSFAILLAMLLCCPATPARAHGVGHAPENTPAEALRFYYSDGAPMAFAEITVFAPDEAEYQNARTDAKGRFAFLPDTPGAWRVVINDGMGHRSETTFTAGTVSSPVSQVSSPVGGVPSPSTIALGLSLLGNLALGTALLRKRKA